MHDTLLLLRLNLCLCLRLTGLGLISMRLRQLAALLLNIHYGYSIIVNLHALFIGSFGLDSSSHGGLPLALLHAVSSPLQFIIFGTHITDVRILRLVTAFLWARLRAMVSLSTSFPRGLPHIDQCAIGIRFEANIAFWPWRIVRHPSCNAAGISRLRLALQLSTDRESSRAEETQHRVSEA